MKPSEVLSLIIRVAGVSVLLTGLAQLFTALYYAAFLPALGWHSASSCGAWCRAHGTVYSLASLYLLRGAPILVRFCYPPEVR